MEDTQGPGPVIIVDTDLEKYEILLRPQVRDCGKVNMRGQGRGRGRGRGGGGNRGKKPTYSILGLKKEEGTTGIKGRKRKSSMASPKDNNDNEVQVQHSVLGESNRPATRSTLKKAKTESSIVVERLGSPGSENIIPWSTGPVDTASNLKQRRSSRLRRKGSTVEFNKFGQKDGEENDVTATKKIKSGGTPSSSTETKLPKRKGRPKKTKSLPPQITHLQEEELKNLDEFRKSRTDAETEIPINKEQHQTEILADETNTEENLAWIQEMGQFDTIDFQPSDTMSFSDLIQQPTVQNYLTSSNFDLSNLTAILFVKLQNQGPPHSPTLPPLSSPFPTLTAPPPTPATPLPATNYDQSATCQSFFGSNDQAENLGSSANGSSEFQLDLTPQDLNSIINENVDYASKVYNCNPWSQYICMDSALVSTVPTVQGPEKLDDLDTFLDEMRLTPCLAPEEIKKVTGIDVNTPPSQLLLNCVICGMNFASLDGYQQHMNEKCQWSNEEWALADTSVGIQLSEY